MKINQDIYRMRRQQLMKQLPQQSVALFMSADLAVRNADCHYPYRQESHFYYLTGFEEPQSILVLLPDGGEGTTLFFCQENCPKNARWEGARLGPVEAQKILQVDQAFPYSAFDTRWVQLSNDRQWLYCLKAAQSDCAQYARCMTLCSIDNLVAQQRLIKDKDEIAFLKEAARISVNAHKRVFSTVQPGCYEYELEAELQHEFLREGRCYPAYSPIVAAGQQACTLHYTENSAQIQADELVLADAGCEYHYYASDITRTFPSTGQFSAPHRKLYELVLHAQKAAIDLLQPDVCLHQVQATAVRILTEGMCEYGILSGQVSDLIQQKAYTEYYMHNIGHWIGLDVHDVKSTSQSAQLQFEPGMVMTVEPGLYIDANDERVPAEYRGIGIRIEDTVLVGYHGPEVLSADLPKECADIEAFMAKML